MKTLSCQVLNGIDPKRKYKEVFISLGGVLSKVYATEVSLEEYLAYTTEESEKVALQKYVARWDGNIRKAIAEYAADLRAGKKQHIE